MTHWAHGGPSSLANMILLCTTHHRLLHEGGYTLTVSGSGLASFGRPDGTPIPASPVPPALCDEIGRHPTSARIGPDTVPPDWYGDRLDLDYAIAVLFSQPNHRAVLAAS